MKKEAVMKLTIGHLYPDLLNLYGDRGNIQSLRKRLEWRGIEAEIKSVLSGDKADFAEMDIVLLGGGSDREQELACQYLKSARLSFRDYIEDGGVVLAVCGGYQLLGQYYRTGQTTIEGLGVLNIHTEWKPERLTGNIILKSPLFKNPVVGFENHGGRTVIGNYLPLGKVVSGYGNTENSDKEGILYKNVIGTYLHGPLLPKNPEVCDFLLSRALKRKYPGTVRLQSFEDELEHRANSYIVRRRNSSRKFAHFLLYKHRNIEYNVQQ